VATLPKLVVVRGSEVFKGKQADCKDAEECKRKHPLNLVQSNVGLLRVFESIEYRDWEQLG
jgi:hypothetical protein